MTASTPLPAATTTAAAATGSTAVGVATGPSRPDGATSRSRAVRGPSFVRLATVELRKSVDTRAGLVLLAIIVLLSLVGIGWALTHPVGETTVFSDFMDIASAGLLVLVPVLGILAMTSEWSQRTTLVTFTLTPRRGRVLAAKLVAAIALGVLSTLAVTALAAVATVAGAAIHDRPADWTRAGAVIQGLVLAAVLALIMGSAVGALLQHTAGAITVYFVLPTVWVAASGALLGDRAEWFDIYTAQARLAQLDVGGHVGPTVTAVGLWILLPLLLGTLRTLRRNVT